MPAATPTTLARAASGRLRFLALYAGMNHKRSNQEGTMDTTTPDVFEIYDELGAIQRRLDRITATLAAAGELVEQTAARMHALAAMDELKTARYWLHQLPGV